MLNNKRRLLLKSIIQTLNEGAETAALLPGNFIALSPDNKLTAIPWGSENLRRVIEQLVDVAEIRLGGLEEHENKTIQKLQQELAEQRKEYWDLRDKLDRIQLELRNF